MDDDNRVVRSVAIRDGRFVSVDNASKPGARVQGGQPARAHGGAGLIESHTHFVSLANRPGYHVAQWELASNLAEVLAMLAARRQDAAAGVSSSLQWVRAPQDVRRAAPADACRDRRGGARTGRCSSTRAAVGRRAPTLWENNSSRARRRRSPVR